MSIVWNKIFCNIFICFAFLVPYLSDAKPVTISGHAPQYAGRDLAINTYADYITHNVIQLAIFQVDSNGYFRCVFDVNEITYIYIDLDAFITSLYAEPNKEYQVVLPPKKTLEIADELNPFFEKEEIFMGIEPKDSTSLNFNIRKFDFLYDDFLQQYFLNIIMLSRKSVVDTAIANIEKLFAGYPDPFFEKYRTYKYALLRFIAYQRDNKFVTYEYLLNKPVLYQNPAFMDFFNRVFDNYFSGYVATNEGWPLIQDINMAKCPTCIDRTLAQNLSLANDTLRRLVMIKGLHDAFYKDEFIRANLFLTLDSLILLTKNDALLKIAKQVKIKVSKLKPGNAAPEIDLIDIDGHKHQFNEFKNKFVYLNFVHSKSYACNLDYDALKRIYRNHSDKLEIITVCLDKNYDNLARLFKSEQYKWTLFTCLNPDKVKTDYQIKSYPTYYLLSPSGLIELSPAPGPNENFEYYFFNVFKKSR